MTRLAGGATCVARRSVLRAALAVPLAAASRPTTAPAGSVVRTRSGAVRGIARHGALAFLGIPYGSVPGRFEPPRPAPAWNGLLDATEFGPVALQGGDNPGTACVGSEQCLSVNVFAPEQGGAGLPVLVWIHGGANVSGASSQPVYDGASFARSGVVCVTFNYRLGLFGFLELGAALGPHFAGSGNNALRDQLLLLRWVRDTIAAFGGDPARVTLAGESAGAKDVAAVLAAPRARGLFARAILESGGGRTVQTMDAAAAVTRQTLELLDLPPGHAAEILRIHPVRLVAAQRAVMAAAASAYPLRPVVDHALLPVMPEDAVALGGAAGVPLLLGTNRDESRLFLPPHAALRPVSGHNLANMDAARFEEMLRHYDTSMAPSEPAEIRWRALTAEEYWVPTIRLAEAQSRAGGAAWMYRFDKAPRSGPFAGRAAHASELAYVWRNPDDAHLAPLDADFDAPLAERMHGAWVRFIRGEAPGGGELPEWPRYDLARRATMIFDRHSRIEDDPAGAERRLWSHLFLADIAENRTGRPRP